MWTMRFRDAGGNVRRDVELPEVRSEAAAVKQLRVELHAAAEPRGEIVVEGSAVPVRVFVRDERGRVGEVRR